MSDCGTNKRMENGHATTTASPKSNGGARRASMKAPAAVGPAGDGDGLDEPVRRLQAILDSAKPEPLPFRAINAIGNGTFSTVYKAEELISSSHSSSRQRTDSGGKKLVALKHLIPTSSADRIFTELECLRVANGAANIIPLLFVHRSGADIVIGMPYVHQEIKFGELVATMDYGEMVLYMRNLFTALAHIHALGIIHRDVKPANFMYNRARRRFALVDFGLAQMTGQVQERALAAASPACKRRLTSSDLANTSSDLGGEQVTPTKRRAAKRPRRSSSPSSPMKTPQKMGENPSIYYYDRRGSLRRTPPKSAVALHRESLAQLEAASAPPKDYSQMVTPPKKRPSLCQPEIRRSPRRHHTAARAGFSTLTISASAIHGSLRRTSSFLMLDPHSGVPSDCSATPLLQASLTSRHSVGLGLHLPASLTTMQRSRSAGSVGGSGGGRASRCACFGLPRICSKCTNARPGQKAARAGTPGFRPPEVLLKSEHQTTAVDMWAAGVVLLCILSRTYPFFRAPDDMTALAEIMHLFGTRAIVEAACQYGKRLICSESVPGLRLGPLCADLAAREGSGRNAPVLVTEQSAEALAKLLKLLAHERITAEEALQLPLFRDA